MNPKFLSDAELIAAFSAAKKSSLSGEKIVSWSSAGTSVSKSHESGANLAARANLLSREIQYRIYEGRISQEEFPHLPAIPRPNAERITV